RAHQEDGKPIRSVPGHGFWSNLVPICGDFLADCELDVGIGAGVEGVGSGQSQRRGYRGSSTGTAPAHAPDAPGCAPSGRLGLAVTRGHPQGQPDTARGAGNAQGSTAPPDRIGPADRRGLGTTTEMVIARGSRAVRLCQSVAAYRGTAEGLAREVSTPGSRRGCRRHPDL